MSDNNRGRHDAPLAYLLEHLERSDIPSISAVRAIAAYMVVLYHLDLSGPGIGTLAVNIFFVLSGFLITLLLIREFRSTGTVSLKHFYIRRTIRIFPAFYVCWLLTVAIGMLTKRNFSWIEAWSAFFYLGDYYHALRPPFFQGFSSIFTITWSLGIEEKFYLIWPAVFIFYSRSSLSTLCRRTIAVVVAIWAYRAALVFFTAIPLNYSRYAFDCRVDLILLGCSLALFVSSPASSNLLSTVIARPWYAPAGFIGLVVSQWIMGEGHFYVALGIPFQGFLIVALLLQLIAWSSHPWYAKLNTSPMKLMGNLSYSIYLYHVPVMLACGYYLASFKWRYQLLAMLLCPIFVALASYRFIELPFLKLKKAFTASGHPSGLAATASVLRNERNSAEGWMP